MSLQHLSSLQLLTLLQPTRLVAEARLLMLAIAVVVSITVAAEDLTSSNFAATVFKKGVETAFVKFYAPWSVPSQSPVQHASLHGRPLPICWQVQPLPTDGV